MAMAANEERIGGAPDTSLRRCGQDRYGPPERLRLRLIDRPAPADDEVLVRVRAASLHPDVWHVVRGRPYLLRAMGSGLRRPKVRVPGTDVAGRVEAAGRSVTRFKPGDEVFGESLKGYSWRNGGAYAEYAAAPEDTLAPKPAGLTFEQAAALPSWSRRTSSRP
jgi:NADPH:quinone reductase-like Zn-dependent oxidoreductase